MSEFVYDVDFEYVREETQNLRCTCEEHWSFADLTDAMNCFVAIMAKAENLADSNARLFDLSVWDVSEPHYTKLLHMCSDDGYLWTA